MNAYKKYNIAVAVLNIISFVLMVISVICYARAFTITITNNNYYKSNEFKMFIAFILVASIFTIFLFIDSLVLFRVNKKSQLSKNFTSYYNISCVLLSICPLILIIILINSLDNISYLFLLLIYFIMVLCTIGTFLKLAVIIKDKRREKIDLSNQEKKANQSNDNVIEKLEKLEIMKEKKLITEQEYIYFKEHIIQKKK